MRYLLSTLIIILLVFASASNAMAQQAREFPTIDSNKTILFPVRAINDTGFMANTDSVWVFSRFNGQVAADAGEGKKVFRRTLNTAGNIDSAFIDEFTYGGGTSKESYCFRDICADWICIDTTATPDSMLWDGTYSMIVTTFTQGDPFQTFFSFTARRSGWVDSVQVDGSQFAGQTGIVNGTTMADGTIGTGEWAAEADNNGINWGDVSNPTTTLALTGTSIKDFQDTSTVILTAADSALISRIVRRMWGIQLGAAGSTDSTTIGQRMVTVDSVQADAINANGIAPSAIGTSEWAAEADNNGLNWADIDAPTTVQGLSGTTILASTTAINLTNAPTNGDLTATMKTSVQTAAAAAITADAEIDAIKANAQEILDTLKTYDNAGRFQALAQQILDTLQTYDNAGRFQLLVKEILDTLQTYDNSGRFQLLVKEILDTLQVYDNALHYLGANMLAVHNDTSAASGVEGAFDNVRDSSVSMDLAHLSIIAPRNDASTIDDALLIRDHGRGWGINIASDSALGGGIRVSTSGAPSGAYKAAALYMVASGSGSDVILTDATGAGSKKNWEFIGPYCFGSSEAGAAFFFASDNIPRRADLDIYSYAAGVGAYIDASNFTGGVPRMFADSLLNRKFKDYRGDVSPDTTIGYVIAEIHDSLDTQGWAATAAGGGGGSCSACGSGTQVDTIKVADTTGTYTLVPNAYVEVYDNATGLTKQAWGVTGSTGRLVVNLSASTAYRVNVVKAGYTFPQHVWTTGAGANYADSANGYDVAISNPSAANLKRIYDYIYTFCGDSVQGADVVVELLTPDSTKIAYDSTTGVSLGKNPVVYTTQTLASGLFTVDLIPNNYIIPHGTRYQVTVMAGRRTIYSVKINATGTAQAVVRSLQ